MHGLAPVVEWGTAIVRGAHELAQKAEYKNRDPGRISHLSLPHWGGGTLTMPLARCAVSTLSLLI